MDSMDSYGFLWNSYGNPHIQNGPIQKPLLAISLRTKPLASPGRCDRSAGHCRRDPDGPGVEVGPADEKKERLFGG